MLYDNSTQEKTVAHWIYDQTKEGKIDAASGYFTVGILAYLSQHLNERITQYRFILGDIVSRGEDKEKPINLLAETITVDAALRLNALAREAVAFLEQNNVSVHTTEPNFCHAKCLLFRALKKPESYFVSGSSNLTEAGLGLQATTNVELNVIGQGTSADYEEICRWFDALWERNETSAYKTIEGKRVHFKRYLIEQIQSIFIKYTPRELYYKTLFELFGDQLVETEANIDLQQRIGHLKHTKIYRSLYDFQQKGVLSLIKKMEDYRGAVLADAVGLGKTWSALAVMKYYEFKGYRTILICPKKLANNWRRYQRDNQSIFESDRLDYTIRYHTDLHNIRFETNHTDGKRLDLFFQSDKPKLIVIDESHNLRNRKSARYQFLVEELLKKNRDVRVLLLSATPINNDFRDLRNQFALLVKGEDDGFSEAKGILVDNIESKFRMASKAFKEWSTDPKRNIRTLLQSLPDEVIRLIDHLVVARNRRHVKSLSEHLTFPKMLPPQNEYLNSINIERFAKFDDLISAFPNYFSAYKPAFYSDHGKVTGNVLLDEVLRDTALVGMLCKLLAKRLESSWPALLRTLKAVYKVHLTTLQAVEDYLQAKTDKTLGGDFEEAFQDEEEDDALDYAIGKREIRLSEIEEAGQLNDFHTHLKEDVNALQSLIQILDQYAMQITQEAKQESRDTKLHRLMELIRQQVDSERLPERRRILIFTAYTDTANYLFDELRRRGFTRIACVSGSGSRTDDTPDTIHRNFEPVLERFCPFTKLYMERDWPQFNPKSADWSTYHKWADWVRDKSDHVAAQLDAPVEILITTDCLSEGQNLQDCDTVINYDIHWNPVRVIQRFGRIDRLGSPNTTVRGINFWPTANFDEYLGLQRRVEDRAIAIAVAGSEVPEITQTVRDRLADESFQAEQEARMLKHLESSWEDIEDSEDNLSFSDLTLELFRQDLLKELSQEPHRYQNMPLGIFTGFRPQATEARSGIVALLGYPSRKNGGDGAYRRHNLVYIDENGEAIFDKPGDTLKFLSDHQSEERWVPEAIENNESEALEKLSHALKHWLKSFSEGTALDDLITGLQGGDLATQKKIEDQNPLEAQYDPENCDLILWFVITP
jgi:superfamily II DNA or RNA helicase